MACTWVEAALNGPWGRELQPAIPVTIEELVREGVAVAQAGAAIVHFHAYDEQTGRQNDDWQIYDRVIEGIRKRVDAIVYPTIPLAVSSSNECTGAKARYRHLDELGRRGLIEWAVVDPGSVNLTRYGQIQRGDSGFVYINPGEHIREGLRLAANFGFHPSFAIYEPGFSRLGAAMAQNYPRLPTPIYRLMFSDEFAWGFPPRLYALEAHLALLGEVAPGSPWMIAGLGVDIAGLVPDAVGRGGHVRVGLEDAPLGTRRSNLALVEDMVRLIEAVRGEPATAAEIRSELQARDSGNSVR